MTAPEPLTLVELVQYLGECDYWLGYDSSGMYIAMPVDGNSPAVCGTGSTPWEAANEAMPERQVAPRDEAAELKAAIKAWAKATKRARVVALARFGGRSRYTAREVSQAQEAEHEAEERLYALAASEGQS